MREHEVATTRRRLFAAWIVTVVLFAAALVGARLYQPLHGTLLGVDIRSGLLAARVFTGALVVVTTVVLLRYGSKRGRRITVKQLRQQAGFKA